MLVDSLGADVEETGHLTSREALVVKVSDPASGFGELFSVHAR